MDNLRLREVIIREHRDCINSLSRQSFQDVKIICQNGEILYSKLLLFLIEPSLKAVLLEDGSKNSVIIYPSKFVEDIINFYDEPVIESAIQNAEPSFNDSDVMETTSETPITDNYFCETCGMSYPTIKQLKSHKMRKHKTGKEQFKCSECDKLFLHRYELNKHLYTHREPSFFCEFCKQSFKRRQALVEHYEQFHQQTTRPMLKCPECPSTFYQKSHLTRHLKFHNNIKFTCSFCNASFNRHDNLSRHLKRKHSNN